MTGKDTISMSKYPHRFTATARLAVIAAWGLVILVLASGCASNAPNIKSAEEAKSKKVLAGRFVAYENDKRVTWEQGRFKILIDKEGEGKGRILKPDPDGYVYIALTPGTYRLQRFVREAVVTGVFNFYPKPFPAVTVNPDDSVINFGTLELRFYQGTGSQTLGTLTGVSAGGSLKINSLGDFEATRSTISSRTFGLQPIRDVALTTPQRP